MASKNIFRTCENVVDICRGDNSKRNLAIDATESHVVDLVTKRRDIGALSGVYLNDKNVFRVVMQVVREFKRERSEASLVLTERYTVDPNCRRSHDAFEVDEDALSLCSRRIAEATAIS